MAGMGRRRPRATTKSISRPSEPPSGERRLPDAGPTLYAFDFDDTVVRVRERIVVRDVAGACRLVTTRQFAALGLAPGETADFSGLEGSIVRPDVLPLFETMRSTLEMCRPEDDVVILTARRDPRPVETWLRSVGVEIDVYALGTTRHDAKAEWFVSELSAGTWERVVFYDDSVHHVRAVQALGEVFSGVAIRSIRAVDGTER